jgi:hypothetical protein
MDAAFVFVEHTSDRCTLGDVEDVLVFATLSTEDTLGILPNCAVWSRACYSSTVP